MLQVTVSFLNWAAPAVFPAKVQRCQAELLGSITNAPGTVNLGVLLSPVFAYQRGLVWKTETVLLQSLCNANLNADRCIALMFGARADEREQRPAAAAHYFNTALN